MNLKKNIPSLGLGSDRYPKKVNISFNNKYILPGDKAILMRHGVLFKVTIRYYEDTCVYVEISSGGTMCVHSVDCSRHLIITPWD